MAWLTPAQCRRARHLLGWSQVRLAAHSAASPTSIGRLESGAVPQDRRILSDIRAAFEAAGVEFPERGNRRVRLRGAR